MHYYDRDMNAGIRVNIRSLGEPQKAYMYLRNSSTYLHVSVYVSFAV